MMTPSIKEKWLEALRSGNYRQGKRRLVGLVGGERRYCCLGVLCDVVDPSKWEDRVGCGIGLAYAGVSELNPPYEVLVAAGLDGGIADQLTSMNDLAGETFAEIADWIERTL